VSTLPGVTFTRIPPRRSTSRAATWWGRAWVRAVEEASYSDNDLHAARVLSRAGGIGAITVDAGQVVARCPDGADVWSVVATVPELDPTSIRAFVEVVAAEPGHRAGLQAAELPHRLVEQAEEVGVELLPYGGELGSACPCQSWVDPCRHALAVLLQVAWLIDGDPWVLLRLRGLSPETLDAGLAGLARPGTPGPAGPEELPDAARPDGDLAIAADAAVRAARVLALLDDPAAEIDHLV
jgi:uncharacterized Zn finger protein